jgi:hypothetical protein
MKKRLSANQNSKSIPPNIRRRALPTGQAKKPAPQALKADDIAKIFGTQDNFQMIKTLLAS